MVDLQGKETLRKAFLNYKSQITPINCILNSKIKDIVLPPKPGSEKIFI